MAKTKVAPAKFLSISRLELCGALLLAKLMCSICLPDVDIHQTFLYTDSTVVLGWINTPTHMLHVFEANRVAAIRELQPASEWRHVRTEDNPADVASRGLAPSQVVDCDIWWQGPSWLKSSPACWPVTTKLASEATCLSAALATSQTTKTLPDVSWIQRISSFSRLKRVVAKILRLARKAAHSYHDPLTPSQLDEAAQICARVTQQALLPKGALTPELSSLCPFVDGLGILRVGGRLNNAPKSELAKHPIIIPKTSHLAKLIVWDIHETYFHAGPTLTLSILRNRYWIPGSMRFIKGLLSKCIPCFRLRPSAIQVIMAPLPSSRFTPGRPFLQTGVDYAGPFKLRDSLRRKPIVTKAYICLFVCLSTKALHLEAVSSLSTEAFLATLDRFVARRGKPSILHSDNATNFVGASRYLKDVLGFLNSKEEEISSHLSNQGVEWRFIPPRSPHFGGLWEAGVKSVKSLLMASAAPQPFTFEELSTILARVESVLNSRPLCPLTDDPDSFDPLTPGHFLIGAPLCALPEEPVAELPLNRLSRWQLVQSFTQRIWTRWRREYLNALQQRSKWRSAGPNLRVNDLVVVLENTSPCGHWPLARVVQTHPGGDGAVRVVTIKTPSGAHLRRSVHRLALLPMPST